MAAAQREGRHALLLLKQDGLPAARPFRPAFRFAEFARWRRRRRRAGKRDTWLQTMSSDPPAPLAAAGSRAAREHAFRMEAARREKEGRTIKPPADTNAEPRINSLRRKKETKPERLNKESAAVEWGVETTPEKRCCCSGGMKSEATPPSSRRRLNKTKQRQTQLRTRHTHRSQTRSKSAEQTRRIHATHAR